MAATLRSLSIQIHDRHRQVIALWTAGWTFGQIASCVGLTRQRCHQIVSAARQTQNRADRSV